MRSRSGGRRGPAPATTATALLLALAFVLGVLAPPAAAAPDQPPQPATGFGSTGRHLPGNAGVGAIDQVETVLNPGGDGDGTRVWVFRPPALRDGTSAPVVVFLHGFALLAPDIYADHILHLVRQGVIVVYPQINRGGLGLLSDNSQSAMLDRAIGSTEDALAWLGPAAGERHLFGHSLGGLLGATWTDRGGPALDSLVLANPSTAAPPVGTGLDWAAMAPATTARTMLLTGEDDTIAAPSQSDDLFAAMPAAASRIVYEARSDDHGNPSSQDLEADHSAPVQDFGFLESFPFNLFLGLFGGDAELDALDHRYYWAALDASIDGRFTVPFDLGQWSDGTPLPDPVVRQQDVPTVPGPPTDLVATPGDQQVALAWSAPADDGGTPLSGYRAYRDGTLIAELGPATTSITDLGLTNGTTYAFEISAVNLVGEGPRSSPADATPEAPDTVPGAPTDLGATPGDQQVALTWSAPADDGGAPLTGYRAYRDGDLIAELGPATTSITDLGLTNGTTYAFEVSAVNAVGEGPRTAPIDATPAFVPPAEPSFADVPLDHPFFADVEWAAARGIAAGYPDGTYRPGAPVSRQATAAFLQRLAGDTSTGPATPTFVDVALDHPFFDAIEWAAAAGIVTGYADGRFRPSATVSRQAMAAFLARAAALDGPLPTVATFPDVPLDHPFFAEVERLVAAGITTGYADGTFGPGRPVTRQSMAAFLHRLEPLL